MVTNLLEILTGSRLHFGLMELCRDEPMCFAGFGMMLNKPSFLIRISGPSSDGQTWLNMPTEFVMRARLVIERRIAQQPDTSLPATIEVVEQLPLHSGLGTGTQFAAAIALGLEIHNQQTETNRWKGGIWHACRDAIEAADKEKWLANYSGRGLRSAIGLTGFLSGGLILDSGYEVDRNESRLIQTKMEQVVSDYRVVTICPESISPVSGDRESKLLESLGGQPNANRQEMLHVAQLATQVSSDITAFSNFTGYLDRYMAIASDMFCVGQGGRYNGLKIAAAVEAAKVSGLKAVGQSSWGPTVFGFAENQQSAEDSRQHLKARLREQTPIRISQPAANGSRFRVVEV